MRVLKRRVAAVSGGVTLVLLTIAGAAPAAKPAARSASQVREVSRCSGQNAEVEQAVDPTGRYVYEEWIGCHGIGFARSTDGGSHFGRAIRLRDSGENSWDPSVTVGPSGTVYAAFMVMRGAQSLPVLLASFDHGVTFPRRTVLHARGKSNWGDRVFVAAGPGRTVYLTWDYGPSSRAIRLQCFPVGSCAIRAGELNSVMQISTNSGKTFGPMTHLSPGYPASGGSSAPMVVDPTGAIDVLYEGYRVTRHKTLALGRAHTYFTSSPDGGRTWTRPVLVGGSAGSIAPSEWWIDGDIGSDAAGNLYATWDTQERREDVGWLAYSTDHGLTWSPPIKVVRTAREPNIVEVAGGPAGIAYVAWLSRPRHGYQAYLSTFSITEGWLTAPRQVSRQAGNPRIWPGDTFGISAVGQSDVMLSWGSATASTRGDSEIFASRSSMLSGG